MEFVKTFHPHDKSGVKIRAELYQSIRDEMAAVLLAEENGMTSQLFFERMHERFVDTLGANTGWYLYQVKLDMEARGMISSEPLNRKRDSKPVLKFIEKQSKDPNAITMEVMTTQKETLLPDNISRKFRELFQQTPILVHSPGRINLIGEHTDYNNGFVMPAAIDKGIVIAIARSKNGRSSVYSMKGGDEIVFNVHEPLKTASPDWANYFLGVVARLSRSNAKLDNFNIVFDGDLPIGAGLSSSAALECAFVFGLNTLFDLGLSKMEMVHIAQWAEHNFVGVKCGIMDQFASMMGKKDSAMLLDCQSLKYEQFSLKLGDHVFLLCDTNIKHALASSEYNTRRAECEAAVERLKEHYHDIRSLRDVTPEMLRKHSRFLPSNILDRATYIVEENVRVTAGYEDLKANNLVSFGRKMFETHDGLSRLYKVSCAELDFLVERAKEEKGILGARMMGGGFGGCTINIIHKSRVRLFIEYVGELYRDRFGIDLTGYVVTTGDGTSLLDHN